MSRKKFMFNVHKTESEQILDLSENDVFKS